MIITEIQISIQRSSSGLTNHRVATAWKGGWHQWTWHQRSFFFEGFPSKRNFSSMPKISWSPELFDIFTYADNYNSCHKGQPGLFAQCDSFSLDRSLNRKYLCMHHHTLPLHAVVIYQAHTQSNVKACDYRLLQWSGNKATCNTIWLLVT